MMSADQATALVHAAVPALGRFGLRVAEILPGRVALTMPLEGNANHMGTMYAGALFAIAELPGGLLPLAALPEGIVPIMKHMTIDFVRPARGPVHVAAELDPAQMATLTDQVHNEGRAEFVLELAVTDDSGTVVAQTRGTYQLRAAGDASTG